METNRTVSQRNILNLELLWDRLGLGQHCQKTLTEPTEEKEKVSVDIKALGMCVCPCQILTSFIL